MHLFKFPLDGAQSFEALRALVRLCMLDEFPQAQYSLLEHVTAAVWHSEIFAGIIQAEGRQSMIHRTTELLASVRLESKHIHVQIDERQTKTAAVVAAWHRRRFRK